MIILTYILVCLVLAKINADLIAADKPINHLAQGVLHLAVGLACGYFINWAYFPTILLTARLWFTHPFYLMRTDKKVPFFYVTPNPKAFTDKIEQKVFGQDGKRPFFIYLALWIAGVIYLAIS